MSSDYLPFVLAGVAVALVNFAIAWRRAGLRLEPRVVAFGIAVALTGLVGARCYLLVEEGASWGALVTSDGGFRLPGGVIGLLGGLVIWRRIFLPDVPIGLVGDVGAIAAPFGLAIIRLGCLSAGCCFGTLCDLPWAIRFPPGTQAYSVHTLLQLVSPRDAMSLPVHPLQIYFMLSNIAVGLFLLWFAPRKRYDGQLLLIFLAADQGGKALLEHFRQPIPAVPLLHLQIASAAISAAAAVALAIRAMRTVRMTVGRGAVGVTNHGSSKS